MEEKEKKYTLNSTDELQGKEVKQTGKRSKPIKFVLLLLLMLALGYGIGEGIDYLQNNNTAIVQEIQQEGEFNINDKNEIITRGTDLALDLRKAGYEIDGEDALYFMLFAGNDDLNEDFIRELNLSDTTERTITDSVDKTLIHTAEAIIGGKEVSIDDYFPNEKDQKLLGELLNIMSHWNTADKKEVADAMLQLNDYMFIKGQYQEYSPQAVVTYIKLFRGFDILTINSGYTLATEDMRNLIYIDQDCYVEEGKIEGRSIHSEQYAVVKEILNEKFNGRTYEKEYEDGVGYEIITEIDSRIKTSGIELGKKTDVQAERDKNNNNIYADNPKSEQYVPPISEEEKQQIVKDPTTGEEYIFQPATEEEKQQQRQEIEEQAKNETKEEVSTKDIQTQWQSGHDAGFMDGVEGKAKASMSGKSEYYVQGYEYGYGVGYDMYAMSLEEDVLVNETFVPTTERVVGETTTSTQPTTTPTQPSTNSSTTNTSEESSFQFVDGFYESDGIIFDSEGNIITDIDGNPLVIPGVNDNEKTR